MKKVMFVLAAMCIALSFVGCEIRESKVKVYVVDQDNKPVADRVVYYDDLASAVIDAALPAPDEPLRDDQGRELAHQTTNAQGYTTFTLNYLSKSMPYTFYVWDYGSDKWMTKGLNAKAGENYEITLQVNK